MDIEAGPLQTSLLGTLPTTVGLKVNHTALARYHSAPSSVLAGLLDDDFFPGSEEAEFARLLNDGFGSFSSLLGTKDPQSAVPVLPKEEDTYAHIISPTKDNPNNYDINYGAFHEPLLQSPLSSISEHGGEEGAETYLHNQLSMSSPDAVSQAPQPLFHRTGRDGSPNHSLSSGLVRQSSSMVGNISKLLVQDTSEDAKSRSAGLVGPLSSIGEKSGSSQMFLSSTQLPSPVHTLHQVTSPIKSTSLLRQTSSPACLLSQINLGDFPAPGVSSSESFLDRSEMTAFKGHVDGRWEAMQHLSALSQRKRGRVIDDDKTSIVVQGSPELANASLANQTTVQNTMGGKMESLEGYPEDIVLCKARAKRGCATHPRSIAERERRMKISERMKKLQDLVPNLDKQASIAEMLDEVVEYVKLLQQQVQELSLNRPLCRGGCQQKSDPPGLDTL